MPRSLLAILVLIALSTDLCAAERPNIILFIADDMAWDDCGAYGHPLIKTPNLDQLAKDGLRFDRAFLTCSSCSPSRCSIITGRYPHNTGAHQLHLPLLGEQITFVEKLKESGYYTASAGKWHLGKPTESKFDFVTTKLNEWVKTLHERPQDKPFFMWFAFVDPHRPYAPGAIPEPHRNSDVVVPPYLPDNAETRGDLALYYDEIARLDGVVGDVVRELEAQNVSDNTLILFISDNGRPFPRCKTTIYDSGVKTPFIAKWPAVIKPGQTTSSIVSTVDLAPTFLQLAGLEPGESFQGVSLVPVLKQPQASVREYAFSEHNWHDFEDHSRSIRSSRFRLIRNRYTDIPLTPPADAVRSPTYQKMIALQQEGKLGPGQQICFEVPRPAEEFYHLDSDPHEQTNLRHDPKYAKEIEELSRLLDRWEQETGDMVPASRRPDGFDRVTGEAIAPRKSN